VRKGKCIGNSGKSKNILEELVFGALCKKDNKDFMTQVQKTHHEKHSKINSNTKMKLDEIGKGFGESKNVTQKKIKN
jgi:hypothetical protein